ncbi:polysaccharide biosynthesis/export family protein [Henriciella aquimarina]|uniref:polysaccharide biosynthesis/export family protein n=1 Tax=Henriciella aquimarina TaxID=545261 RepID=UPI000A017329|nr:polysaccharide biosynthesis/export family protein [Henriciella aquimarina]
MLTTIRTFFACLILSVTLAACQSAPMGERSATQEASGSVPGATVERTITQYRLGSSDRLKVTVYGEPELSGEFVVDGQGFLSLPLAGEIKVDGLTVREFQRLAEKRLGDGYLREPRVSAEVVNYRPYYILGEVNTPGEYPYSSGLTVLNAIATAEGFTYRANQKYVLIKGIDDEEEAKVELKPTTRVEPGDTIRVVERFF